MARIFVVEDNAVIREAVCEYLRLADHEVLEFGGAAGVLDAMKHRPADLLILDVMLPDGNGFTLAKDLRAKWNVPFLFLTAREQEADRLTGFELGADDYVVKPFSVKELVMRVSVILKRSQSEATETPMEAERWVLEGSVLEMRQTEHKAFLDGREFVLTAAEWKILYHLALNPGMTVSRERILGESLDYVYSGSERTVDTHIKNLRSKLEGHEWIETVRGYGYRFKGNKE